MGEIRQNNFRIDNDTADAFRHFCDQNGFSQAQGFDHIMQVLEINQAKAMIPKRLTEIEEFEKMIKKISAAYLNSLEINENAESRVHEQFASALERKDKTIDDLQEKVEKLSVSKEEALQSKEFAEHAQSQAEEREKNAIEQMDAAKKTATDQERLNNILTEQLTDANAKLEGYEDLKKSESTLKAEVEHLKAELNTAATTLSHTKEMYDLKLKDAQKVADKLASTIASETDLKEKLNNVERDLKELKKSAERDLKDAQTQSTNELIQFQAQAELEKERVIVEKERELHEFFDDKLRTADKENAKLTVKVEQLEDQLKFLQDQLNNSKVKK